MFHYLKVAKSILWTVIGCWPSEWLYYCIYTTACFSNVTGVTGWVVSYRPFYFLTANWTLAEAAKCCYSYLFCMLEQWLLQKCFVFRFALMPFSLKNIQEFIFHLVSPGLTANHHTGNGRDQLHIGECPNAHIIFPSWCSSEYSLSCVTQHMNYTQVQNFDMALRTGYDLTGWESIFIEAGISATSVKIYAQTFSSKEITRNSLHMLDHMMLKELGIKTMGDMLAILKLTKEPLVLPVSHMKLLSR